MKMIDDVRADNMAALAREFGSTAALAAHMDRSESQVSQWVNRSKNSATGKPRGMRSSTARWIELVCAKPHGWLDQEHGTHAIGHSVDMTKSHLFVQSNIAHYPIWPFPRIDQARFFALPQSERDVIEGILIGALQSAETRLGKRSVSGRQ